MKLLQGRWRTAAVGKSQPHRLVRRPQPGFAHRYGQRSVAARRDQPIGIAGQFGTGQRACWSTRARWCALPGARDGRPLGPGAAGGKQLAAQVEAARANAALAPVNIQRCTSARVPGFVSKAEIDSKRAIRDAANAQVRVAQAQLGATRAPRSGSSCACPTSGLVLARSVDGGQTRSPGSPPLFRLAAGETWRCGRSCRNRPRLRS